MTQIWSMSATMTQPADAGADQEEEFNSLNVEIADYGEGPYAIISTDRWALSDPEDIDKFVSIMKELVLKVAETRAVRNN